MGLIQEFLLTQEVALGVLRANGIDCEEYEIWLRKHQGRDKLLRIENLDGFFPAESVVQDYAGVLLAELRALMGQGASEELLIATYDYVEQLDEMILQQDAVSMDTPAHLWDGDRQAPLAANSNLAMVA